MAHTRERTSTTIPSTFGAEDAETNDKNSSDNNDNNDNLDEEDDSDKEEDDDNLPNIPSSHRFILHSSYSSPTALNCHCTTHPTPQLYWTCFVGQAKFHVASARWGYRKEFLVFKQPTIHTSTFL